jgi:ParB family chromosome partitioning protein
MALVENLQREDINPIESAHAYRRLSDEFGLTQDQIASKVGKSRVAVANALRLLRLPESVQQAVQEGHLTEGHARALLMVDSPARLQSLFERAVVDGLSVREVERMARGEARSPKAPSEAKRPEGLDPDWEALRQRVSEHLGARVGLDRKSNGGRLTIDFYSEDELDGLLEKMGLRP